MKSQLVPTFNKPLQRALLEIKMGPRKLNQQQVAALAGITKTRMTLIARDLVVATPAERKAIAKVLRLSVDELFEAVAA